ncbi:hypothetical protein [Paraclostridium sordellii]|uniref:hypothetical protein n=1 Tax=Paraclostridium sordellii TaxID=1505 RepID=UPI000E4B6602|nr:hypothetical protein [Paeniclostridium sordellii]RGW96678.1 hypothetical protein DWV40_16655 [Paeniclostridium sordellii]
MNDICWKCKEVINEYCYSITIYFLNGDEQVEEEIITAEDMKNYENDIKKEYDGVDYVGFGEYCPHCLASM